MTTLTTGVMFAATVSGHGAPATVCTNCLDGSMPDGDPKWSQRGVPAAARNTGDGHGRRAARSQLIVFETGAVCALSIPTLVIDESVKYQVPLVRLGMVTVVVVGLPMVTIWLSAVAVVP